MLNFTRRQLFRRHSWNRAYFAVNPPPGIGPVSQGNDPGRRIQRGLDGGGPTGQKYGLETEHSHRISGAEREPRDRQTQFPVYETPPAALETLRTSHGLTVCVSNLPLQAHISEVLDLVLGGPIFRIDDIVHNGNRTVALTFFHKEDALAFHQDVTSHDIDFFGHAPKFSWQRGTSPQWNKLLSRSIIMWDKGRLGTKEDILSYLCPFGPIDRIVLMNEKAGDRAFINFLSAESGCWAVAELRKTGARAQLVDDRCLVALNARALALNTHSRAVVLRGIPSQTSFSELCDRIRGGLIHRISYVPESGVAFVYFVEHSSAAYFLEYAVYRGIIIHGRRLNAVFLVDSERLPIYLAPSIKSGATRCLAIEGIVNPDMLRNDCMQYGHVERVGVSESVSNVSFSHIHHAIKALRMLPTKLGYEGLKIAFAPDPCAAPYPQDLRNAVDLQAEIASFLLPSSQRRFRSGWAHLPDNTSIYP
ncbi:hypothetical protein K438DRAFT_1807579 [Mycena galopus ATCC 62051]|nr:hypothetical protein K438DRAFT_1807579 [Mycena galopus ATCC 62051]